MNSALWSMYASAGDRLMVRALEADMHDIRLGLNNPYHYCHTAQRILNEKDSFCFQCNIWSHHTCVTLNYSYKL
jgi:hypothetical protein